MWSICRIKRLCSKDLAKLKEPSRSHVLKAIRKVSSNPLPFTEGGYGQPLGNEHTSRLTGLYKIKLKKDGICVVYRIVRTENIMRIIVISIRYDETVYRLASQRVTQ